jgi:hypothetical protein
LSSKGRTGQQIKGSFALPWKYSGTGRRLLAIGSAHLVWSIKMAHTSDIQTRQSALVENLIADESRLLTILKRLSLEQKQQLLKDASSKAV